jgi:hypothetical protein
MKKKLMTLDDYKLTSTYAIKDGVKPEWEAQLNIYALMLREHGYRVDRLRVVAILRDWQKAKAKHTQDYPQLPALVIPVPMWPAEQTESYIRERLIAHGKAQHELPQCSAEERWERPSVFALYKKGNTRATSLHDTQAEAEAALAEAVEATRLTAKKPEYTITKRPAEQKRCQDYCAVFFKCEQGQRLIKITEDFRLGQFWSVSGEKKVA